MPSSKTRRWLCDGCGQWSPAPWPGPLAVNGVLQPWLCCSCNPATEVDRIARRLVESVWTP